MDIQVNVVHQKLKMATNLKSFVAGTQKFIRFAFNFDDPKWDDLTVFAQFQQNGNAYNQFLDEHNCAYLPAEIVEGECTLMLYGSGLSDDEVDITLLEQPSAGVETVIGTTNYLTLTIDGNILVENAESTVISTSLYNQLVSMVQQVLDAGYYMKPSTGIPKSHLASTVQTSLEKADSALQTHQNISNLQPKAITDAGGYYTTDTVEAALQQIGLRLATFTTNGVGTEIPAGANIDSATYRVPGTYAVPNATRAATIIGTPTKIAGYRLETKATGTSGYVIQVAYINGGTVMFRYYNGLEWTSWLAFLMDNYTPNDIGIEIPPQYPIDKEGSQFEASDLNDYTTPGNYRVATTAAAQTIRHSASMSGGYRLEVKALSSASYLMQIAYLNGNTIRTRYYNGSWGNWYTLDKTQWSPAE